MIYHVRYVNDSQKGNLIKFYSRLFVIDNIEVTFISKFLGKLYSNVC